MWFWFLFQCWMIFFSSGWFWRWSLTPSFSGDGKKSSSKGLPWWFVFIAWFLVAATSGVSGFFTMLYGLHYGKENSIKWLISMAISFFESLFITQPLKVRSSEMEPLANMSSFCYHYRKIIPFKAPQDLTCKIEVVALKAKANMYYRVLLSFVGIKYTSFISHFVRV